MWAWRIKCWTEVIYLCIMPAYEIRSQLMYFVIGCWINHTGVKAKWSTLIFVTIRLVIHLSFAFSRMKTTRVKTTLYCCYITFFIKHHFACSADCTEDTRLFKSKLCKEKQCASKLSFKNSPYLQIVESMYEHIWWLSTVYPIYAHGFCFAVLCCG